MNVNDALVFSKKTLNKILRDTLSPDQETKDSAEASLRRWQKYDDFDLYLIKTMIDVSGQIAVRESAAGYLKNLYKGYNSPDRARNLATKYNIRQLLFSGLGDSNKKIRNTVAVLVIEIVSANKQEYCPDDLDVLLDYLSRGTKFAVDGALKVLCMAYQHYRKVGFLMSAPDIFPKMCQILEAESQYSLGIQSQALHVCAEIMEKCEPDFVRDYLQPMIPMLCKKFIKHLSEEDVSSRDICVLKCNIVKAITGLAERFPKCIADFFPQILSLIWKTLINSAKEASFNGSEDIDNGDTDLNGRIINHLDNLVRAILHFIVILMREPCQDTTTHYEYNLLDYHWFDLQHSLSPEVLHHLILLMQMTDKKIKLWAAEPSKFLKEEELLDYPDDIRTDTKKIVILHGILCSPKRAVANALVVAILKQMEFENKLRISRSSGTNRNWKVHEAFLLAFCLAKDVIVQKQNEGGLHFDIVAFLENVVLMDLNDPESHPLVIGRCLCLGGLYAEQMPPEISSRFITATINGLQNQSSCVKICAAIAVKHWLRFTSIEGNEVIREILESHIPALFQGLFDLGTGSQSSGTHHLVMENLYYLALFHRAFTTSVLSEVYTLTVTSYLRTHLYGQALVVCKFFFKKFIQDPEYMGPCQSSLTSRLIDMAQYDGIEDILSLIFSCIKNYHCIIDDEFLRKVYNVAQNDIDTAKILVLHSLQPLGKNLIDKLFPSLCQYIIKSASAPYRHTLSAGGELVCTYLSAAPRQVMDYKDEHGKTGQEYILHVAAQLMNGACGRRNIVIACKILTLLMKKACNTLEVNGAYMEQLLSTMLSNMKRTYHRQSNSVPRQHLLMIWAHLIITWTDPVLNFLSTKRGTVKQKYAGETAEDPLAIVIYYGFCREYLFFKSDEHQIVNLALRKILEHGLMNNKLRLHGIAFEETEEGKTTMIPLLVKIFRTIAPKLNKEDLDKTQDIEQEK